MRANFLLVILLAFPSCFTPKLWEPDTPGYSAHPQSCELSVTALAFGQSPQGEILDGALAFVVPANVRVPRALREGLVDRKGSLQIERKRIGDSHFPVELYGTGTTLLYQDLLADKSLRLRLVVTNTDARKSKDLMPYSPGWEGKFEFLRGDILLQSMECTVRFIPEFPLELGKGEELLAVNTEVTYREYRQIPRYKTGGLILRILATPITVAADMITGLVILSLETWLNSEDDDC